MMVYPTKDNIELKTRLVCVKDTGNEYMNNRASISSMPDFVYEDAYGILFDNAWAEGKVSLECMNGKILPNGREMIFALEEFLDDEDLFYLSLENGVTLGKPI